MLHLLLKACEQNSGTSKCASGTSRQHSENRRAQCEQMMRHHVASMAAVLEAASCLRSVSVYTQGCVFRLRIHQQA